MALHGAYSNPLHNLRRVFGLDNRPGETDDEAARNPLPLPDVPALVVSPFGRGALMGYDGLGEEDVMRVIADVRRAYNIDPERMTLTGLSMGGGATWAIGLRHPEMFAALAPVCAMSNFVSTIPPSELPFYDVAHLRALSPPAIAENAAHVQVMIFHGADDPTVPVEDSRVMAARYRALGWLGKNVQLHGIPGREARRLDSRLQGRGALAHPGCHSPGSGGAQRRRCLGRRPARPSPAVTARAFRGSTRTFMCTARTAARRPSPPPARWRRRWPTGDRWSPPGSRSRPTGTSRRPSARASTWC